jgi:23S rRNA (adenine2503-C2)-methyltransferase
MSALDLSVDDLADRLSAWGEPRYRAKQIYTQLWRRSAEYAEMSDIAPDLRDRLSNELPIRVDVLQQRTADRGATRKALLRFDQGHVVEAVLMGYRDRVTVCVSSQAGCAMGCTFCATGQMGLLGNLSGGQIAAQVRWARREAPQLPASTPRRLTNVVFMGMGEPMSGCLLPSHSTKHPDDDCPRVTMVRYVTVKSVLIPIA